MLIPVTSDEIDTLIRGDVGRIALYLLFIEPVAPSMMPVIIRSAVQEPDEFVKAVVDRIEFVRITEVPLAEKRGGIIVF